MNKAAQRPVWDDFVNSVVERWNRGSTRKQLRSRRREKEILAAALRVFARDGISRARLGDVAAEAAVPLSTLYEYYPSKEELAYQVPLAYLSRFYSEYAASCSEMATARERLRHYLWLSADFARRNPQWARLLYLEIWPSVLVHESILRHCIDDYVRIILHLIVEGGESGEWPRDTVPYETAAILAGSLNQLIITKLLYNKPKNLSKAAESLLARVMSLLDRAA